MSEVRSDAGGSAPVLSIVVPFYNVEAYFEECLESLRAQTLSDFEVIMVDDGSPDDSVSIARRFADQDPRFVLVRQQNQGLGPARNTGVAHARGRYLTFVDSDDVVAPRAYSLMVGSLERTGSAFVAADVYRFGAFGFRQSWTHRTVCRHRRTRTTLARHPELMGDRMVWNKVYRRSFWDSHQLEFPAIKYEDYPVTLRAYLEAPAVDILTNHVYFWRERESGDSITQQLARLDNVRDRYQSAVAVLEVLGRHYPPLPEVRERVHGYFIHIDLVSMTESLVRCAPEDRAEIERMLVALARRLDPAAGFRSTRLARLIHRALLADDIELARDLASWRVSGGGRDLLRRVIAHRKVHQVPAVVRATGMLRRRQAPWRQRRLKSEVQSAAWEDGILHVTVRSSLRGSLARLVHARAELADSEAATGLPTTVRAVGQGVETVIRIRPDDVAALRGSDWSTARLWVRLRLGPLRWRGPVRFEAAQLPGVREHRDGYWIQPGQVHGTFGLQRVQDPFVVDQVSVVDGQLQLSGGPPGRTLTVCRPDPSDDLEYTFDESGVLSMSARDVVRDDPPDNLVNRVAERRLAWLRPRESLELHQARAASMASAARAYQASVAEAVTSGASGDDVHPPDPVEIDPMVAEPVLMRHTAAVVRAGDLWVGIERNRAGQLCVRQEPVTRSAEQAEETRERDPEGLTAPDQAAAVADVDAATITDGEPETPTEDPGAAVEAG